MSIELKTADGIKRYIFGGKREAVPDLSRYRACEPEEAEATLLVCDHTRNKQAVGCGRECVDCGFTYIEHWDAWYKVRDDNRLIGEANRLRGEAPRKGVTQR